MRLLATLALATAFATPVVSTAQVTGQTADEQTLLKQVQTDKRAIYARSLDMSDSESRAFWPIYEEYEAEAKTLDDRFLAMVNDYAANYETLEDARATALLKEKLAIEKERMSLKLKYTAQIAKVLPPKKALRYAQVETRIDNMLRSEIYSLIPLAH
jgi:Spy/CpxP family protein refolding chaperone